MPISNAQEKKLRQIANGHFQHYDMKKLQRLLVAGGAEVNETDQLTTAINYKGFVAITYNQQVTKRNAKNRHQKDGKPRSLIQKQHQKIASLIINDLDKANQPQPSTSASTASPAQSQPQ